ncbi:Uncharacterized conserved protein, contains FIST_N domain [Quadrisphaera granulorum]|uniref:FIST-like protein n=1 Tax=Quadrisphaera granulorum TaxID=317664 RepID=A0A315ZU41_9ACTN|nr:FIST N-terminal domain-containing protein [Quadrisphaera granulorum]PWJ48832.1 hypothetical protein BXY45_12834 [Quadrisphaera granulorum]SZE98314.1 Uncharacterized conserved protein, contains FIST_N domain [Quadrisphaera granulorum]
MNRIELFTTPTSTSAAAASDVVSGAPGSSQERVPLARAFWSAESRVASELDPSEAAGEVAFDLRLGLQAEAASLVLLFASSDIEPDPLIATIEDAFPEAIVAACSTAGEFTDESTGTGGISALALPATGVRRVAAALAPLGGGAKAGGGLAVADLERQLGSRLRDLDPARHVGILLVDGVHGDEEAVNEALGNAAPLLDVVGGSAGDDLAFAGTWVALGSRISAHGAVVVVLELEGPFTVFKTCSFTSTGRRLRITAADPARRTVLEFDGRPAAQAYADALGVPVAELASRFMDSPLGLMVDGEPWIRSPQRLEGDAVVLYCQVLEGMEVEVMASGDLIADTRAALDAAVARVGGTPRGAVVFNCILRRLEIDTRGLGRAFTGMFAGMPTAGFHTYGESLVSHINQTATGIVFG